MENKENKGYIHVYTGNGKGKTTAALGLALRAAGWEKKTYIAQFMKKSQYGELFSIAKQLHQFITIQQFGLPGFHHTGNGVTQEERDAALEGIAAVKTVFAEGTFDIVILDEANMAAHFKIIGIEFFLDLMDNKPEHVELILTGRKAPWQFIERADLVTEMKEIKHYYSKAIPARFGVEK